jgi:heat shock protein HtpX
MIANMLQWALIFGMGGGDEEDGLGSFAGTIAIVILTPIIATMIQLAISRSREYMADEGATKIMKTPQPLIGALQKLEAAASGKINVDSTKSATASLFIVNPFRGGSLFKWFSTHPSTEDRIKRMRSLKIHR